jgi:FAD binding domain
VDERSLPHGFIVDLSGERFMNESGFFTKADTLAELADKIGVDADGLHRTASRFAGFARTGVDEDFHRGDSAHDRVYSDPRVKPNPNLGAVSKGPFYAVKLWPGDLGTKGGLLTDEHAREPRCHAISSRGPYRASVVPARQACSHSASVGSR